ncbi:MFS family permease [Caldicoprobacter guelmensis]|uniref:MFS transporter n=1 Tax=Caldicoprobacter guelmensis TaxID=1170224 RepID=UPI00195809CB|nr:MFS transporter [Caldicoprobacter guelmensis]MBM7583251.1 MFS family permease [Caldicoprobacter guelmensis]
MNKYFYRIPLFCIVTSLYWFSMYSYVPILSPYAESLGASYRMIGVIVGSYGFTQMLLRIPLGILSDRRGNRKLFIIMGVAISLISAAGLWFSTSPLGLLAFRGLSGIAASAWVAYTVLFPTYFAQQESSKAVGIINSFTTIGQVSATLIGGYMAQRFGPRSTFLVAIIGGLIGLLLSLFVVENKNIDRQPFTIPQLLSVSKNRELLLVSGLAILVQFITFATTYGFTPVVAKNIGASDAQLGILVTVSALPAVFSSAASGSFFTKHYGEKRTIIGGFIIISLACASIPFIKNIHLLYISQAFGGIGRGLVYPLLMALSIKSVDDSKRATAMGFFQAIYGIGMFLGPAFTGFVSNVWGLSIGFALTAVLGFLGALIAKGFIKQAN